MKQYWNYLDTKTIYENRVVRFREDKYHFLPNNIISDYTVFEFTDWVNIIPITPDGMIITIRQFRHGIKADTIEIPGGLISAEDRSPLDAAKREMEEETGYSSRDIRLLGMVEPNPAIQTNKCYTFLANDVYLKSGQNLDPTEAISIDIVKKDSIYNMIRDNRITHSLVVAAFAHLMIYENYNR